MSVLRVCSLGLVHRQCINMAVIISIIPAMRMGIPPLTLAMVITVPPMDRLPPAINRYGDDLHGLGWRRGWELTSLSRQSICAWVYGEGVDGWAYLSTVQGRIHRPGVGRGRWDSSVDNVP